MNIVRRETLARLVGGCGVAIVLTGGAIATNLFGLQPKPKPAEEFIISCQRCWDAYPEWWCSLIWGCPPKPPDPPPEEGGDRGTATKTKSATMKPAPVKK